jgi:hypothetical protein
VFSGADGRFHLRVRRAQEVSVALDPLAFRTRERYEAVTRALRVRPTVPSDAPFLELRVRREPDRNR